MRYIEVYDSLCWFTFNVVNGGNERLGKLDLVLDAQQFGDGVQGVFVGHRDTVRLLARHEHDVGQM